MWRGLVERNVEEATLAGLEAWLHAKLGFSLEPTDRPHSAAEIAIRDGCRDRVVPPQHPAFEATRLAQGKDAFEIGNWGSTLPVLDRGLRAVSGIGFISAHSVEKARRRQLLLVAHDDDPAAARDKTQGVLRAQLICLVDDEEIEIDRTRWQELRDRDRAHEKNRLDFLDRAARRLHQLAQRHVSALAADFAAYHTHFA